MPPKVKSTQPLDAMATQPDSPPDEQTEDMLETQRMPEGEAPTKRKRGRPKGKASTSQTNKGRPTKTALVKNLIPKNILVHPEVVQKVLGELENLCVETLKTKGIFRMSFITLKIRTREAREAGVKHLGGRDVTFKAKPERRSLNILPGKNLRQLCK